MKLYIKNMVCSRCKMVVKSELEKLGLQLFSVELGEVETISEISDLSFLFHSLNALLLARDEANEYNLAN